MDVDHRLLLATAAICSLCLTACSQQETASTVFPETLEACQTTAIKNRFVVKWKNGEVSTENGINREQFIKDFVQPHLKQIELVEQDQKIQIPSPSQPHQLRSIPLMPQSADNWGDANINVAPAWQKGITGSGIMVAVVDTGVDASHPQLRNQIAYNLGEYGVDSRGRNKAYNGIDDDGNGLIDDYAGYHFFLDDGSGIDASDHGSHVSGIIAAEHHQTSVISGPVQGVAPGAKILPAGFLDTSGGGNLSDALRAIDYSVARGARIINASWGGAGCSQALKDKITSLYKKNIAFVTAAGNGNQLGGLNIDRFLEYPASYDLASQFTVGAIDGYNIIASFSNYGVHSTHVFAPGVDIFSTVPGGGILSMSGTSMATPFVTGTLALLMSHRPQATLDQIRAALYQSVDVSNSYLNATRGRINVARAISELEQLVLP